jgi:hypothetical protein
MTNQFTSGEQACLLNPNAECNRIWVSKPDGLRLAHFQTLGQKPVLKETDGAGRVHNSDSAAYEECLRGCLGPR